MTDYPTRGGTYIRDPETGALTLLEDPAEAEAQPDPAPVQPDPSPASDPPRAKPKGGK